VSPPEVHVAAFDELDARTAYLLWQLREAVFVVEQACPYPELDGRDLEPGTRHLWVAEGERPVGYLRLLEEEHGLRIGRVLVAADRRGRGIAATLMGAALGLVGDRPSHLDAQSHLTHWYARFGYEASGPEFVEDGIPHVPMRRGQPTRAAWSAPIRSPQARARSSSPGESGPSVSSTKNDSGGSASA
jgi:ElaA protein